VAFNPVVGSSRPGSWADDAHAAAACMLQYLALELNPARPISLNPAEMMIALFTPASTHSPMIPGTV